MLFLKEFFAFLIARKKLFMLPFFLLLILIGVLLVFAQGSVFAPFIYTLF